MEGKTPHTTRTAVTIRWRLRMHLSEYGQCSDPITTLCSVTPVVYLCVTLQTLPASPVHGILQARTLARLSRPPPEDLPDPGTEPVSLTSPVLAAGFFTTSATREAHLFTGRMLKISEQEAHGSFYSSLPSHDVLCFGDILAHPI